MLKLQILRVLGEFLEYTDNLPLADINIGHVRDYYNERLVGRVTDPKSDISRIAKFFNWLDTVKNIKQFERYQFDKLGWTNKQNK